MTSMDSWKSHLEGKRHNSSLRYFHKFYSDKSHGGGQDPSTFIRKQSHSAGNTTKAKKQHSDSDSSVHNSSESQRVRLLSGEQKKSTTMTGTSRQVNTKTIDQHNKVTTSVEKLDTNLSVPPPLQGGLMLNILETVGPDVSKRQTTALSPPKRNMSLHSRGEHRLSGCTRGRPMVERNKFPPTGSPRGARSSREVSTNRHSRPNSLSIDMTDVSSTVEKVPSAPSSPTVPETHEAGGDLRRMQEALEISQKLETLKVKQMNLEKQLHQLQTALAEVRTERRDLKARRKNLLRGLAQSDSEDENVSRRPSLSTELPVISGSLLPDRLSSEKQVASVAPVAASCRPGEPVNCSSSSVNGRNIADKQPARQPGDAAHGDASAFTTTLNSPSQTVMSLGDHATSGVHVAHQPPSLTPSARETHLLPNPVGLDSTSSTNGIDLERLALIRQAIQSPDSWQFTFEQVDQMLRQTAAKATVVGVNAVTSTVESAPPTAPQTPAPPELPKRPEYGTDLPVKPCVPFISLCYSACLIKGEPPEIGGSVLAGGGYQREKQTSSTDQYPIASKSAVLSNATDSCDSSDDDQVASHLVKPLSRKPPKIRKMVKAEPEESGPSTTQYSFHQTTLPDSTVELSEGAHSIVTPPSSPPPKQSVKFGEFHAFDGGTAAVIDMILHQCTSSMFIGGQNGIVVQFDLKTHQRVKQIASRDASVTKMAFDPQERSLFTAYYDNHLAEYNIQTGTLLWEKSFSNRVEALATAPLSDVPFIFLGMSSGDILRHHMVDRTTSVLFSQIPICAISSMAVVRSGPRLFLLVGYRDCSLFVREASDGSLVRCITSAPHKGPPGGITGMPCGSNFCSYSERALRIHNWKTGVGVLTLQTQKITSCCVLQRYIAVGDSEGTIRQNGLPGHRPTKVYYASHRSAITSLTSCGVALISGGLDGTVTVICITEPVNNYTCLYGPFGHQCGIGFESRKDLVSHVMDTHLIFGNQKSVMCRWGAGRCRTRFTDTQSIKSVGQPCLLEGGHTPSEIPKCVRTGWADYE
ncbi:hypothetical protein T265_01910 [Opisthorchis viverrini]|uniref:Uncharacterized protein n=1 Tax=Opisthorchis viverrini TaxID=6198 RepID=A0A074ZWY6_OPIVI|nr:hypothetical protein T265_01910 [Opisthorchis viverrini]KER31978.1 hypothetical protein T265_01910 [Opisthorchis viverrini]